MDDTSSQSVPSSSPQAVSAGQSGFSRPVAQPPVRPVVGTPTDEGQQGVSRGVEQGPVAASADDLPLPVSQEVPMQQSHPEFAVPSEIKEMGGDPGPDAKKTELPKEVADAGVTLAKADTPVETMPGEDLHLPMSLSDAQIAEKKAKSSKNSLSWYLREIIRQWKKRLTTNP